MIEIIQAAIKNRIEANLFCFLLMYLLQYKIKN